MTAAVIAAIGRLSSHFSYDETRPLLSPSESECPSTVGEAAFLLSSCVDAGVGDGGGRGKENTRPNVSSYAIGNVCGGGSFTFRGEREA